MKDIVEDATDVIGGANGTLVNGASISGGAVVLNAASAQYVDLPNNLFTNYNSVTFEVWATDNASAKVTAPRRPPQVIASLYALLTR